MAILALMFFHPCEKFLIAPRRLTEFSNILGTFGRKRGISATTKARVRPLDAAVTRILQLAGRGAAPSRMAREVQLIIDGWEQELGGEVEPTRERVDGLHELLASGVEDAEEQVSDVDRGEAAALRQAQTTLAALVSCRDAVAGTGQIEGLSEDARLCGTATFSGSP